MRFWEFAENDGAGIDGIGPVRIRLHHPLTAKIRQITAPRKYNAAQRRIDIADAAIDLLGRDGSRGLSHPRVDRHGGLPTGTTSYYFRTRKALLHGVAERLRELDLADLSMMDELSEHFVPDYAGTMGLARLVMLSAQEPYLTRTRARFELILHARRDPDLAATTRSYGLQLYRLAREVIARWYGDTATPASHIEERAVAVLTYISGVMFSVVAGTPVISDADDLDIQIRQLLHTEPACEQP